jgi:hypothetical protein
MIFEFAVDPEVVATWHDRSTYRFYDGKFGPGAKRTLCRYPGTKWRRLVLDAFHRVAVGLGKPAQQAAKKRLEALLLHLQSGSSKRNQNWSGSKTWIECALAEHRRRPFHGLVVSSAADNPCPPVYQADRLEEGDSGWNPIPVAVPRSLDGLVDAVTPVLTHGRSIALVDPYFDPAKTQWAVPFLRMLVKAQAQRTSDESLVFEVHTSVDRSFGRERRQEAREEIDEAEALAAAIVKLAAGTLGPRATLVVRVWSDKNSYRGDEEIHNRYLLTECGGVMFGKGFDTAHRGKDTPTLLSRPQWESQRVLYSTDACEFRLLAELKAVGT